METPDIKTQLEYAVLREAFVDTPFGWECVPRIDWIYTDGSHEYVYPRYDGLAFIRKFEPSLKLMCLVDLDDEESTRFWVFAGRGMQPHRLYV